MRGHDRGGWVLLRPRTEDLQRPHDLGVLADDPYGLRRMAAEDERRLRRQIRRRRGGRATVRRGA